MENQVYCIHCINKISADVSICPLCGQKVNTYMAQPHHLLPFTILNGKYLIGRVLGEGGFGITYIARDLNLDIRIAIKEYYPFGCVNRNSSHSEAITVSGAITMEEFEAGKRKLMGEARTLAKLSDLRGVVGVRDFFLYNNTAYIVMDYLEGITLKDYLKANGTMSLNQILTILAPIMDDLVKIHGTGLIHRDISPDNIMILKDGTARLLDFGAARQVSGNDAKSLSIVLKPGYTPEEQYRSKGEQGPWTDVYALAATIYRAISGRIPDEALQRVVNDELEIPSGTGAEIGKAQEDALMKGLAVFPRDRYQNMEELKSALLKGTDKGNVVAEKLAVQVPIGKAEEKKKLSVVVVAAAFLVSGIAGMIIWSEIPKVRPANKEIPQKNVSDYEEHMVEGNEGLEERESIPVKETEKTEEDEIFSTDDIWQEESTFGEEYMAPPVGGNWNEQFLINENIFENYVNALEVDEYLIYRGIDNFYFSYPAYLYNQVRVDRDEWQTVYGTNIETIMFQGSAGSRLIYSLTEIPYELNGFDIGQMTDYFYTNEFHNLFDASEMKHVKESDYGRVILTGYLNAAHSEIIYDLAYIGEEYLMQMQVIFPAYTSEDDKDLKGYVTENLYRLCGFSGSQRSPRSYEEYWNANHGGG